MITWRRFRRWATHQGYSFAIQGTGDEVIIGVGETPISTGFHNHPDGVPDRLLKDIADCLGMTKRQLEEQI